MVRTRALEPKSLAQITQKCARMSILDTIETTTAALSTCCCTRLAGSSFRQRRAAGVVLLACCFHGSRATATRLHRGGYISISKPWRLVIKRHSRDWRRGSSSKKSERFRPDRIGFNLTSGTGRNLHEESVCKLYKKVHFEITIAHTTIL